MTVTVISLIIFTTVCKIVLSRAESRQASKDKLDSDQLLSLRPHWRLKRLHKTTTEQGYNKLMRRYEAMHCLFLGYVYRMVSQAEDKNRHLGKQ